jgi:hypothetical protein
VVKRAIAGHNDSPTAQAFLAAFTGKWPHLGGGDRSKKITKKSPKAVIYRSAKR